MRDSIRAHKLRHQQLAAALRHVVHIRQHAQPDENSTGREHEKYQCGQPLVSGLCQRNINRRAQAEQQYVNQYSVEWSTFSAWWPDSDQFCNSLVRVGGA